MFICGAKILSENNAVEYAFLLSPLYFFIFIFNGGKCTQHKICHLNHFSAYTSIVLGIHCW